MARAEDGARVEAKADNYNITGLQLKFLVGSFNYS